MEGNDKQRLIPVTETRTETKMKLSQLGTSARFELIPTPQKRVRNYPRDKRLSNGKMSVSFERSRYNPLPRGGERNNR